MNAPLDESPEEKRASSQVFDWEALKDYFGYVKNALLRHKLLALGTFVVTAALGLALAKFLPRTFYSEATLQPKRASTIAALVNPDRIPALDADPPNPLRPPGEVDSVSRSAAQALTRHDNLVAIIKRVNLLDRWDATRAPLLRLKDSVMHLISGRPTEEVKLDAMEGMLEKALTVSTDDGKITIAVTWPDPQLAHDLVEAAQQSFLEARQQEDLANINDAMTILQDHQKVAEQNYDKAIMDLSKIFESTMIRRRREVGDPRVGGMVANPLQAFLRYRVRSYRRADQDTGYAYQTQLAQEQAELLKMRQELRPNHPSLITQEKKVQAMREQGDTPRSSDLLQKEADTTAKLKSVGGGDVQYPDEPVPDPYALERVLMGIMPSMSENPGFATSLDEVRSRTIILQQLRKRMDSALLEQDIVRASFKYRYTLLSPPDFPRAPVKPNAKVIAIGGILAGLLLGLFAAIARDVLSGRFLQSWQVKRGLGLPVLAEMEDIALESHSQDSA